MKSIKNFYIISALVYFTQGFESLPSTSLFFFLKEQLHYTPEQIMYLGAIISIAWIAKPILGVCVDNYLSKKTWIMISLAGSIIISLFFGLSPILTIPLVILFASIGNTGAAIRDISVDGCMCEEGKINGDINKIQTLQWISITIASIVVGLGGGYIADHCSYKFAYLCLIPTYLITFYFTSKFTSNITNKPKEKFLTYIKSYAILIKDKRFMFACLFLFLYKFSPSFGTPLSFIERDVFKWSGTTMGIIGATSSCFSIVGAVIFYKLNDKIDIKKWLYLSVFLGAITTLSYLYYTPISAILYAILYSVVGMFIHLIVMGFLAKSTIDGKEATSFAILCAINNLAAGSASSLVGAKLFPIIGLNGLIIISALTSFICLPIIKKLEIK